MWKTYDMVFYKNPLYHGGTMIGVCKSLILLVVNVLKKFASCKRITFVTSCLTLTLIKPTRRIMFVYVEGMINECVDGFRNIWWYNNKNYCTLVLYK